MPHVVDSGDQRIVSVVPDDDRKLVPAVSSAPHYPPNGLRAGPCLPSHDQKALSQNIRAYTLMVAGQRSGKTSFLRLLLDSSDISPTATKDQLASVAKFVQGCSGHTSHIRSASINIDLDLDRSAPPQVLTLSLVDTPSLDLSDEHAAERNIQEILRQVDTRLAEGIDDEWKAQTGDHHIHLCIYFLDPDVIVPPGVPGPPAPLVPRARTNSFSRAEPEHVILEPPVTTNPLLCRPTLPTAEIDTIRRLSARVNVLPVIARADTLTNDRLAAVKMAVRRDLAEAGIGFGIFDMDTHPQYQHRKDVAESGHPVKGEIANGYGSRTNRSSPGHPSPPTSPTAPSFLRLPYALISPEIYSHSDGVARVPLSRHELVHQYTPSSHYPPSNLVRGKFIRSYRWGSMDILDPNQCDFMPLRSAIFHHMETLQKYTREYLFEKFRAEYLAQHHPGNHLLHPHQPQPNIIPRSQLPVGHPLRPALSIETSPNLGSVRHPSLSTISRDIPQGTDMRPLPIARPLADGVSSSHNNVKAAPKSSKQRPKKITVACNFCRSRKLKCDGGRPACGQCLKRSNACDYMPQNSKRRNPHRRKEDESESDLSGEERSADEHDHCLSPPEASSQPLSRKSSNADKRPLLDGFTQPVAGSSEPRELHPSITPIVRPKPSVPTGPLAADGRCLFKDNELPHIATLALPESSPTAAMTAPPLPLIRPASEQQAAQRKRASTMPGRSSRQTTCAGPKVVACNFCRARKTKCDGGHPACSSCARRSLPCNYNHDSGANGGAKKGSRRASMSSKVAPHGVPPPAHTPPSPPSSAIAGDLQYLSCPIPTDALGEPMDVDLKRKMDDMEVPQMQKRIKVDDAGDSIS